MQLSQPHSSQCNWRTALRHHEAHYHSSTFTSLHIIRNLSQQIACNLRSLSCNILLLAWAPLVFNRFVSVRPSSKLRLRHILFALECELMQLSQPHKSQCNQGLHYDTMRQITIFLPSQASTSSVTYHNKQHAIFLLLEFTSNILSK